LEGEKAKKKAAPTKRKVTPLKIRELAAKKQKLEKAKVEKEKPKTTPRKKSTLASQKHLPMDVSPSTSGVVVQPQSSGVVVHAQPPSSTNDQVQQGAQQGEKQFDPSTLLDKKKREGPVFNDKNLDYNLYCNDPDNVVSKKIKISNNVIMTCRMIDGSEGRKTAAAYSYDYAALSFLRKTKDEKAFEFNLPLNLAPNIIEAIKLIINDNPKFFQKYLN
jgi:hypothetical protein